MHGKTPSTSCLDVCHAALSVQGCLVSTAQAAQVITHDLSADAASVRQKPWNKLFSSFAHQNVTMPYIIDVPHDLAL